MATEDTSTPAPEVESAPTAPVQQSEVTTPQGGDTVDAGGSSPQTQAQDRPLVDGVSNDFVMKYVGGLEQEVAELRKLRTAAPATPAGPDPNAFDYEAFEKSLEDELGPTERKALAPLLKHLKGTLSQQAAAKAQPATTPAAEQTDANGLNFEQRIEFERFVNTAHAWFDKQAAAGIAAYGPDRATRDSNPVFAAQTRKVAEAAVGLRNWYQSLGKSVALETCFGEAHAALSTDAPLPRTATPEFKKHLVARNNQRTPPPASSGRELKSTPSTRDELVALTSNILANARG